MNKLDIEIIKFIFSSIFIVENRLLTACEKIQDEITMKQWLLLAIIENTPEDKTLTELGKIMGCSRQNIKKLAETLYIKGFIEFKNGPNNSIIIKTTSKSSDYANKMSERHLETLNLLFSEFSENEIEELYNLYKKLYIGLEKVETYARDLE